MFQQYEYLYDNSFLKIIDELDYQIYYVKITSLNRFDEPIASLEGVATGGNISLNGNSAIRRTGSVTLLADAFEYSLTDIQNIIAIDKRIQLEIGIENTTDKYAEYPIIWFPLGIYIISQPSINYNQQNYNISLSLKDKMVLLNGEVGGTISTMTTFSPIKVEGSNKDQPVKIYDLIYSLVVLRGGIPADRVIIQDIDNYLKQTVQYIGTNSLNVIQKSENSFQWIVEEIEGSDGQYSQKDNVGYTVIDFVYPSGETLSCAAGDSIVSVLDKIKNTLGNYEYFFDIEGIFHFQQIKNFLNEGNANIDLTDAINNQYFINTIPGNKVVYEFTDNNLVTAFQNSPQFMNIKNNIVIWGDVADKLANAYYYQVAIDTPPSTFNTWYVELAIDNNTSLYGEYKYAKRVSKEAFDGATLITPTDWRTELYFQAIYTDEITYYSEKLIVEWPRIYDIENGAFRKNASEDGKIPSDTLTYYFDMIDPNEIYDMNIRNLSVANLGVRTRVTSNEKINCLFYPMPPDVCFIKAGDGDRTAELRTQCINRGWNYTQIYPKLYEKLNIGSGYNAAYDLARSMLHELIDYNANITITALPIYHLEPNMRIKVKNKEAQIDGDYLIQTISLPLTAHSGTMSLTCSKAIEKI